MEDSLDLEGVIQWNLVCHIVNLILKMLSVRSMPEVQDNMGDSLALEGVRMRLLVQLIVSQTLKIQPVRHMWVNTAEEYRA